MYILCGALNRSNSTIWIWRGITSDLGYSEANISSTFNDAPLDTKLFKTIEIEGDKPSLSLTTIGDAGSVSSFDYVTKENTHYAYIRGDVSGSFDLRYTKGVGEIDTIVTVGLEHPSATHRYTFPLTHQFDGMINQGNATAATGGDLIFGPSGNFGRVVKVIDRFNLKAIETIQTSSSLLLPSAGDYLKVIKDNNVESLGLRGTYMDFTMRFSGSIFTVGAEAMKSFP